MLILAAFSLLGAIGGLRRYTLLVELAPSLPVPYLIGSRAVWAVVFGGLGVGLWRLREWARRGLLAATLVYLAVAWAERLGFARSDFARTSLPFHLALHALTLAFVWWTLLRRGVRQRFSA